MKEKRQRNSLSFLFYNIRMSPRKPTYSRNPVGRCLGAAEIKIWQMKTAGARRAPYEKLEKYALFYC